MTLERIVQLLAPWQTLYANSRFIPPVVTATHLLSMLAGGGLAIAADRATLRLTRTDAEARDRHLGELRAIHRPVVISIAVLLISGIALSAADIETFAVSPMFWLKLALFALLLGNGWLLTRVESRLRSAATGDDARSRGLWTAFRRSALASIALWCATLIVGVLLVDLA